MILVFIWYLILQKQPLRYQKLLNAKRRNTALYRASRNFTKSCEKLKMKFKSYLRNQSLGLAEPLTERFGEFSFSSSDTVLSIICPLLRKNVHFSLFLLVLTCYIFCGIFLRCEVEYRSNSIIIVHKAQFVKWFLNLSFPTDLLYHTNHSKTVTKMPPFYDDMLKVW